VLREDCRRRAQKASGEQSNALPPLDGEGTTEGRGWGDKQKLSFPVIPSHRFAVTSPIKGEEGIHFHHKRGQRHTPLLAKMHVQR